MTTTQPSWEHFPHDADMGIRGRGPTLAQALAQAGLAMTAIVTDPDSVEAREAINVECAAATLEDLFFDWLDAIVFEMSTRRMLFGRFDVDLDVEGPRLWARLFGEPIDRARHEPAVEIKGPTQTELRVEFDPARGQWMCQCVVDV